MSKSEDKIREITCIACPIGCRLVIQPSEEGGYWIEGYTCLKGKQYAEQEMRDPKRLLTSTVKIRNGFLARLPVKTDQPIPKQEIFPAMQLLSELCIEAPVKMGQILIADLFGSGANIVATRDMGRIE